MSDPFITPPTSTQPAPTEHWRREVEAITADARRILLRVAEARRIWKANRLGPLVAATPPGQAVPGTTISREQAEAWQAMVAAVDAFLGQEITEGFTVEDGLYAMWPAPVEARDDAPAG